MTRVLMRRSTSTRAAEGERRYACRTTAGGGAQVVMATISLTVLGIAFSVTLGGMSGVEECFIRESRPPPHPPPRSPFPPPPPRPPPPTGVCTLSCKLQNRDRHCNPQCNIPACNYDGGDCRHAGSVVSRAPSTMSRGPTLNDIFRSIGRRMLARSPLTYDDSSYSYDVCKLDPRTRSSILI